MNFRDFGRADVDKIIEIERGNFSDGWNEQMLLSAFDTERFYCIGLEVDGQTVGLITYSLSLETADIEGVVTIAEQRGKGYASRLVERALERIEQTGIKKVFLEVRETNLPAICLYKKFGFEQISVRKNYYPDGENAFVMVKELL